MSVSATFPTANMPSATTAPVARNLGQNTQRAEPPQAPVRNLQGAPEGPAEQASTPHIKQTRATIAFDPALNRVVGEIVDKETGEEIVAIPPEKLKALYARMRENLGPLVDEKV